MNRIVIGVHRIGGHILGFMGACLIFKCFLADFVTYLESKMGDIYLEFF